MVKKPSEKNKTWEKDRRDRLNKAFDQLAKLLPKYDPSVSWTKNEIIQKAIVYVEQLHEKRRDSLKNDSEALKRYDELLECLKFYQSRNGQLSELLQNAKITIPPVKVPKFLVESPPPYSEENNFNNINTRSVGRPKKYSNLLKTNDKPIEKDGKNSSADKLGNAKKKTETSNGKQVTISESAVGISQTLTAAPLDSQSTLPTVGTVISTGVLLPVVSCQPVSSSILPVTSSTLSATQNPNAGQSGCGKKCNIISVQNVSKSFKIAKDKNGKILILPKPGLKLQVRRNDGKIPIPWIKKKKIVPVKKRRKRKKKPPDSNLEIAKRVKLHDEEKPFESFVEIKNTEIVPKVEMEANSVAVIKPSENLEILIGKNISVSKKEEKPSNTQLDQFQPPDLSTDYFSTLQIPQNETNSGSLSPTAAFLLSFPVVSTAGGKNSDIPDESMLLNNTLASTAAEATGDGRKEHESDPSTAESLENLNTFFTTKEYHKYCETNAIEKSMKKGSKTSPCKEEENPKKEVSPPVVQSDSNLVKTLPSSVFASQFQIASNAVTTSCCSSSSSFTFNLTTAVSSIMTTSSKMTSSTSTTYCNSKKPVSDWLPSPTIITNDYKTAFTFSLTPSTTTITMATPQSNSYSNTTKPPASNPIVSIPPPMTTDSIFKTNLSSFDYSKMYNPHTVSDYTSLNNSYSSTGFTFSLTSTKNSLVTTSDSVKPSAIVTSEQKFQYSGYGLTTQSQFSQSNNSPTFTFALTKPTKTTTSTQNSSMNPFSIDATLGINSNCYNSSKKSNLQFINSNYSSAPISNVKTNNLGRCKKDIAGNLQNQHLDQNFYSCEQKAVKVAPKTHVNWMTSTDFGSSLETTQTTPSSYYQSQGGVSLDFNSNRKNENYYPPPATEENLPPWSPSKVLDTSHLLPSTTLPNYYGDMGLNNSNYSATNLYEGPKSFNFQPYDSERPNKSCKVSSNVASSNATSNFFSVSQLVEQRNENSKTCDTFERRTSHKSKDCKKPLNKPHDAKLQCQKEQSLPPPQSYSNQFSYADPKSTTALNIYSAEALISKKEKHKNYSRTMHSMDYYNPLETTTNSYPSGTATIGNMDRNYNPNFFYNYVPPAAQSYSQETDYLGAAYCPDVQYGKVNKPQFMAGTAGKLASAVSKVEKKILPPLPPAAPPPAPPNLSTYDPNYYPVHPPVSIESSSSMMASASITSSYDSHHYSANTFQSGNWTTKNSLPTYHLSHHPPTHHHQQPVGVGVMSHYGSNGLQNNNNGQSGGGNLTNFNLSTICPEINDKVGQTTW